MKRRPKVPDLRSPFEREVAYYVKAYMEMIDAAIIDDQLRRAVYRQIALISDSTTLRNSELLGTGKRAAAGQRQL